VFLWKSDNLLFDVKLKLGDCESRVITLLSGQVSAIYDVALILVLFEVDFGESDTSVNEASTKGQSKAWQRCY